MPAREVAVGVVRRPFGLRGEVFVHPDPDLGDAFPVGQRYRLVGACSPDAPTAVTVRSSALHRGLRIVRFGGVTDRDAAARLRDAVLWRDASAADVDDETFWSEDLVGRPVVGGSGEPLGTVTDVRDGPAHDYLVVAGAGDREVWVPAVAELVTVEADRVVVADVPGLFDDGAEDA